MDPKEALKGLVQEAVAIAVGDVTMNNAPAVDHAAVVFKAIKTKSGVSPGDASGSTKVNGAKKAKSTKKGKGKGKGKADNNSHVEKSRRGENNQHTARNTNIKKWAVWKPNLWKGSFAHQGNSSSWKTGPNQNKGLGTWVNKWPRWTSQKQGAWAFGGQRNNNGWKVGKGA